MRNWTLLVSQFSLTIEVNIMSVPQYYIFQSSILINKRWIDLSKGFYYTQCIHSISNHIPCKAFVSGRRPYFILELVFLTFLKFLYEYWWWNYTLRSIWKFLHLNEGVHNVFFIIWHDKWNIEIIYRSHTHGFRARSCYI